jgi:hypothetical protein
MKTVATRLGYTPATLSFPRKRESNFK